MGIIERKEREKQEMRQQILDAARKLFLEQGFEKTSIRNIADEIEYSPATIYLYYKDKNELLFALHQEAFDKLIEEMQAVVSSADPFERLVDLGRHYFKYAFENPELYDLMFVMKAPMDSLECRDDIWDDGKSAFAILQKLVSDCQVVGYFKNCSVDDTSLMIWSFVHGLATLYIKNRLSIFPAEEHLDRMENSYQIFVGMLK
jgi:AcrR family transcriptional regulator